MFTCPENDIHSIYLDNELPENFKADYEAHLEHCPKCKAKLEALRKTHQAIQLDSKQLDLSQEFLDASFERLQSRMRYSKTTSEVNNSNVTMFPTARKYIPMAVAAAAVFALVLPIGLRNAPAVTETVAAIQTLKRTSNFSLTNTSGLKEVSVSAYPVQTNVNAAYSKQDFLFDSFTTETNVSLHGSSNRRRSKTAENASNLLSDDFFSPSFVQNDGSSLQVYMPSYVDISLLND